jgi:predicted RNA-binding protein YlqC (UPF0109 family)
MYLIFRSEAFPLSQHPKDASLPKKKWTTPEIRTIDLRASQPQPSDPNMNAQPGTLNDLQADRAHGDSRNREENCSPPDPCLLHLKAALLRNSQESSIYHLLYTIVRNLVDRPEDIIIQSSCTDADVTFTVRLDDQDLCRLSGEDGQLSRAIECILGDATKRLNRTSHLIIAPRPVTQEPIDPDFALPE